MNDLLLLTPGPTPIQPDAQRALGLPMRSHMDAAVFELNAEIQADLRVMYGATDAFTCLLAGTGSLGMEAGFANLIEPGDAAIVCANGSFGYRMAEMARRAGAVVTLVTAPIGKAIRVEDVQAALDAGPAKVLAVVHGETSTGVLNPAPEIARLGRDAGALVTVDAVTTAGMMPFHANAWGVDYAYTGSQKCLSAPPGTAPVMFSPRAQEVVEGRATPVSHWYADLTGLRHYWNERQYHHTVPVQLHYATHAALRAALNEGLAARAARVRAVGNAALDALALAGFTPFVAAADRLPTVLAVRLPEGLDDAATRAALYERGVAITGGLGETAGKIWRLGLMGEEARADVYARFFEALEAVTGLAGLVDAFERGCAVAA
ncbi:MAG TPA: aminotransferase class V-fold PLP-dependent enzyme [Deinococcales bacterium]|nr:aminotransferase class V-fold PLP-dependent enzyme [Deinococcales bacterium]